MKERGKIMKEEQKTEGCSESACSSCSQAGSCSSKKVDLHEPEKSLELSVEKEASENLLSPAHLQGRW